MMVQHLLFITKIFSTSSTCKLCSTPSKEKQI